MEGDPELPIDSQSQSFQAELHRGRSEGGSQYLQHSQSLETPVPEEKSRRLNPSVFDQIYIEELQALKEFLGSRGVKCITTTEVLTSALNELKKALREKKT